MGRIKEGRKEVWKERRKEGKRRKKSEGRKWGKMIVGKEEK